jgi:hypothetical protein
MVALSNMEFSGERNTSRSRGRNRKTQAGMALLTMGTALMVTNLCIAAAGLPRLLATLGVDVFGAPVAAALGLLRFLQALAFHPTALLPFAYGILVLFIALAGILAGAILLLCNRRAENA